MQLKVPTESSEDHPELHLLVLRTDDANRIRPTSYANRTDSIFLSRIIRRFCNGHPLTENVFRCAQHGTQSRRGRPDPPCYRSLSRLRFATVSSVLTSETFIPQSTSLFHIRQSAGSGAPDELASFWRGTLRRDLARLR
jgi:hypothetical protein